MKSVKSRIGTPLGIISSNALDKAPVNKEERIYLKNAKIEGPNGIRKSKRLNKKILLEFKLK